MASSNNTDLTRVQASYDRSCGQTGFNPNADINNDCKVDLVDFTFVGARRRAARPHATPTLTGRRPRHRSPDRHAPDCLAPVQRRRRARRHRHRSLDQRRRDRLAAHRRRHARTVRPGHHRDLVPDECAADDDVRRGRPRVPGVGLSRLREPAARRRLRRCAHRRLELDQRHHLDDARAGRQSGRAGPPADAGAHLR